MRSGRRWCAGGVALLVVAACAGDGSAGGDSRATPLSSPSPASTAAPGPTDPATTSPDESAPLATVLPSALPPEPTGVAGVDAADPFCAAWARYSGSVQSLAIAAAFGDLESAELARLEVLAAAAMVDAVGGIGAAWPAELGDERAVVLGDVVGPFARRADKAVAALVDSGATMGDLAELAEAWADSLRRRDPEQPVIDASAPSRLVPLVDAAATAFDAVVTPFAADPSLTTAVADTPATDAYLADRCPELADSGVGDAV